MAQVERQAGKLHRLAVACPRCGSRPAARITEELRTVAASVEADTVVITLQCQRRRCGHVYEVRALALQLAD